MSNINRSGLDALSSSNFPDNTTQLISAADLRDWIESAVDSFVTQKDKSTFENAFYEAKSATILAAPTVLLSSASGNFVHIQGTTNITSFGTCPAGSRFILCFEDAANITASASLIIPGTSSGNTKTAVAGDCCMIVSEGGVNWRIVGYFPAAGGGGGGTVTSVTATAPLASSGGTTPDISIPQASASQDGYLDQSDFATFAGKQDALSAGTGISIASNTVTNTAPDQTVAITSGTGINATGTYPNFTIANTAPDQTVSLTPGTGIGVTGSYPSFTISNTSPSSGGTVTTTGTPTSGQITKFSGSTSITNAIAGTDYIAPPSGTAILKANSGGALANAIAGTDYLAPPSGTAIQKANSGGALANASAGTDYVAPGSATGSGLTMATSRLLGRTTASPNPGAIEEITVGSGLLLSGGSLTATGGGGSGTVNSGTANRLTYYSANGTAVSELPTAGSAGQILQSNGTGSAPSWVNAPAATMTLGTSVVSGATTAGRLLLTTTSGANQVLNQDSLLNYDTTNDRLGIGVSSPTGTLHLAAGVAANPQVLLAPSAITPTGTTNGSIWCNTVNSNTTLTMYKDSGYTKVITLDRNPDLATGSSSGLVISDSNGTLSKSGDLTSLGVYSAYADQTATSNATSTSLISSSIAGSLTLPANFFALGKTIRFTLMGIVSSSNGDTSSITVLLGGSTIATLSVTGLPSVTNAALVMDLNAVCNAVGTSATLILSGMFTINNASTPSNAHVFVFTPTTSSTFNSASSLALDLRNQWGQTGNSVTVKTNMCYFIN